MEEVILERCILCTHSLEAYRRFIASDCGALLPFLVTHCHSFVSLGDAIPSAGDRPALTVVDLTPATQGVLSDETTVIVLPPIANSKEVTEKPNAFADSANLFLSGDSHSVCDEDDEDEDMCFVELDESLPAGSASAPLSFFLRTLLPSPSAAALFGDAEYATALDISLCEAAPADAALRAGRDAFRNIRAAALLDPQPSLFFCCASYRSRRLRVRLSLFRAFRPAAAARFVALAPAWPDAAMSAAFGGRGFACAARALRAAGGAALGGRLLAEGDVCALPGGPGRTGGAGRAEGPGAEGPERTGGAEGVEGPGPGGVEGAEGSGRAGEGEGPGAEGPEAEAEAALQSAARAAGAGGAALGGRLWAGGDVRVPLRVVAMEPLPAGRMALASGETEVVLRPFDENSAVDETPLSAPFGVGAQFHAELSLTRAVRDAVGECYAPRTVICKETPEEMSDADGVFVVHATRDNMPCECIAAAVADFGVHCVTVDLNTRDDAETEEIVTTYMQSCGEVALIVRNAQSLPDRPETLRVFDLFDLTRRPGSRVVFLLCETMETVPPLVAARARNARGVLRFANPSEADRRIIVSSLFAAAGSAFGLRLSLLLSLDSVAAWTVGLSASDVLAFARECVAAMAARRFANGAQPVLSEAHCARVLRTFQKAHGHSLVSTQLQPVRWGDVGGLEEAKRELRETIQLPILHPELFGEGAKRRMGILFYGPPGCGKTLLAKAVATEMNMNFMSVKGPELINQYVGESELNIRLLFQRARDNSPCIVFFDELDALAPQRGEKGDAGGAMDRVVAQLLVELDGVGQMQSDGTNRPQIFVIGATNRPDLLDPSLLRPGRFDRLCYLGIPGTRSEQIAAVQALTRKFDLDKDVDIPALLESLPFQFTGADFFALCSDAMMFAVGEMLEQAKANIPATDADYTKESKSPIKDAVDTQRLVVSMSHFLRAKSQLKASVTAEDLKRYELLKTKFAA